MNPSTNLRPPRTIYLNEKLKYTKKLVTKNNNRAKREKTAAVSMLMTSTEAVKTSVINKKLSNNVGSIVNLTITIDRIQIHVSSKHFVGDKFSA